jgi:hypothetical protein
VGDVPTEPTDGARHGAGLRKAGPHCLLGLQASSDGRRPQHNERIRCDECDEAALAKRREDNARFRATRRGDVQSVGVVIVPGIPQRTCVTLLHGL